MPRPEPAALGDASLDQLRVLREESERRLAVGRRGVVELPVDEVHPDPDQVRRDFAGDVVAEEDAESLRSLAANVAAVGIHNPIHVRADPDGGYRIVSGERRWRAAGIAGLEVVPCLVDEDVDPTRNTLVQLAENLQRSDLKLLDVAQALARCLEETGLSKVELARELGRPKAWLSKHLALLKAPGALTEALEENRIGNVEAARLFARLGVEEQERLLRRARRDGGSIPHKDIVSLEKRRRARESRAEAPHDGAANGEDAAPETPDTTEGEHVLRLSTNQLRDLVRRLGGDDAARPLEEELFRLLAA